MEKEIKNKERKNVGMNVGAEMPAEQIQAVPNEPMMPQMPQMPAMQQPMTPQMPMMQYPMMPQMPLMPGCNDMQGMECMPAQAPTCPYLMNMQCPMLSGQGMGNMSQAVPQYQPPIYMMYPYMGPNR